ncbi:ABC transporter ATP-binding protein [Tardiphaga sp.]|jgi:capsular polysaccharide transport system ATP-binding protein|uniref:ABC transporter ATP-binding protein n=1 Tax=Tardiphaga sp. TaxID=1926292 RepID=UPI0037D9CD96
MIEFFGVTKVYKSRQGSKTILQDASFSFEPGHNFGILGGNGAGKSTLIRLIAGAEPPDKGRVQRRARVSFPVGFSGTFHPHLSGRQNASFIARIYGESVARVVDFVGDFSELGEYFDMPVETYSAGMTAKLAFGVSLGIDFDVYLVDEVIEVGDARFRQKCAAVFAERMERSDLIMVSHNSSTIRTFCDRAAILSKGELHFYDSVDAAMRAYWQIMGTTDA